MGKKVAIMLAGIVLSCGACDKSPQSQELPISKSLAVPLDDGNEIVPGVGAKEFRIGMSEADIAALKAPSEVIELETAPDTKWLDYPKDGIQLVCKEGQVSGVIVFFHLRDYESFAGGTKEGIGSQSSIRDVICTYGQPTSMSKTKNFKEGKYDEWDGKTSVGLTYMERGLYFEFVNEQLVQVSIAPKQPDYDPGWQQDIGDVAEYRDIACEDDQSADIFPCERGRQRGHPTFSINLPVLSRAYF